MKKYIFLLLILSFANYLSIAQISFKASANKVVEVGENFRLNFSVNARGSGFKPPSLSSFAVLAGPSTSTSSRFYQDSNGKTVQSMNLTYTYILQARKSGKYTIGKAEITIDGKKYNTQAINIEAIKGGSANNTTNNTTNNNGSNSTQITNSNDLFVRINLNKSTVYQGEQIVATIKIYDRIGLKNLTDYKFPKYTGFWTQDIETNGNITLQRENVNGKLYKTGVLKQTILFPQRSGILTITPFELECVVQKISGKRRNFFGEYVNTYVDVEKKLKSTARRVKVLPLPDNKPASFKSAVGSNFRINANIDRKQLKSNESITLKVNIAGNGNIKLVDVPTIKFPSSFEVFDPKITDNISNTLAGSQGNKTFEYLLIPREQGEYTIPEISFSYFDVNSKSYKTIITRAIKINVDKGEGNYENVNNLSVSKEDVESLGTDIRHIKLNKFTLKKTSYIFFGSVGYYSVYLISLLIFVILIFILRRNIKIHSNLALQRNRKANKISKKRLKLAASYMKENDKAKFYDETIKALWGYLSDKLNIPVSELSRENVKETLFNNNVEENIINDFIAVIDNCEFAKYAPATNNNGLDEDYKKASEIINTFERVIA